MANKVKQRLKAREATVGSWMQLPNSGVAEIMGKAGFDWVAIDLEHGSFGTENLADLCRALELGGTVPFARVAQCTSKDIKVALEAGCRGIIVPMIETAAQLRDAISWASYPPRGTRGIGYSRANLFGREFQEYLDSFNEELVVVAQIESIAGARNLEEILQVPGLDAIFVGPYDLSASIGLVGQFGSGPFVALLADILKKAAAYEIPAGLHIVQPDPELLRARIEEGYSFIAYGIDGVFLWRSAMNPLRKDLTT